MTFYNKEREKHVSDEKHMQGLNIAKIHAYINQISADSPKRGNVMWNTLMQSLVALNS